TYSDSTTQDITSQATWTSSNTPVATVNAAGLASTASAGATTISAALTGVTGSTVLTVQASPVAITTTALPNGSLNVAYSSTLSANGGSTPYGWSITSGSLPTGLTLTSASGVISGTPSVTGTFSFTTRVNDSSSPAQTATKA